MVSSTTRSIPLPDGRRKPLAKPATTTRREFLHTVAVSPLAMRAPQTRYDLLIKGGRVVDPSRSVSSLLDVAVTGDRISRLAPDLAAEQADRVIDASGKIVTAGLIDVHVHVYAGVAGVGIWPDVACLERGATTVVDGGSAGATTLAGFNRYVVERAQTRVRALLNLSSLGLVSMQELSSLGYADVERALRAIEAHRDIVLGIKVRMTSDIEGGQDARALSSALRLAEEASLPLMVHIGGSPTPLGRLLDELRPGDIVTHTYRAQGHILDRSGNVLPEARAARERGVRFDVGHGAGNFSFRIAERALDMGFLPDSISSDIHSRNVDGPVFDLATTLSKFLHMAMSLEQCVACATSQPASMFPFTEKLGSLEEGAEADIAVLDVVEGEFLLTDSGGDTRTASRKLVPVATVKGGQLVRPTDDAR